MVGAAVAAAVALVVPGATGASQTPGSGWTQVHPGGDTGCALDTPFSFFHRTGTRANRVLLYFQGGGACWDWLSCSGLFDHSVEHDEPAAFRGLLDPGDPRNPLRGYSVVFVPYCTGDVHIGDARRRYGDAASRPVAHLGARNVAAVLDWLGRRAPAPEHLVVVGTSAGAYGALMHAPGIARRHPHARVVVIGDSGVPLLPGLPSVLASWGADSILVRLGHRPTSDGALREAYRVAADVGPTLRVAQVTTDRDAIQSAFYLIAGSPHWRDSTFALLADARRIFPGLRTFMLDGSAHGLVHGEILHSAAADGVRLVDWIGQLVDGPLPADVSCATCRP